MTLETFRIPICSLHPTMRGLLARMTNCPLCLSLIYNTHYRDIWTQVIIAVFKNFFLLLRQLDGHEINHQILIPKNLRYDFLNHKLFLLKKKILAIFSFKI